MPNLRFSICLLLISAAALAARASDDSLAAARKLWLHGKYAEAAELYTSAAGKDPVAAIGLARCLTAQGKDADAVKVLTAVQVGNRPEKIGNLPHNADILAELAAIAFEHGSFDESQKRAEQSLKIDRNQLLARWITAELARVHGKLDEADRGYAWLIRYYNDNDVTSAEQLHWIGLAAAQSARWNRQSDQFHFLVNELYPDALKQDPDYWPARFEAGMLFLEKYNQADAAREIEAALEINPNSAEIHTALALLALEGRDVHKAELSLRRALEINPRSADALLLQADLLWVSFQMADSLSLLEKQILPLNPLSEQALGRVAACYLLLDGDEKTRPIAAERRGSRFSKLVAEVTKRNPHGGEFYFALASQLEARNKQVEAEPFFREAIRLMPRLIGPEGHLGMLYMLAGREDEARKTLRAAFRGDPFNVRVKNSLEVLDVLEAMQSLDTARFTVRYQPDDKLMARYAARHLDRVYPLLCKRFGYDPPEKTLVELFNEARGVDAHQWFSTRMIGLPYLDTIAASTGRIVGMVSPSQIPPGHQMNWARVLTHETVHVITLQQTRFNCPHWFTEGLAVWSERCPRPRSWCELLQQRMTKDKLFNLDTLNAGFTRPETRDDRTLAYCQSELYVDYMVDRNGEPSLRALLAAYTDGLSTAHAIRRVFGCSQTDFERGYAVFLTKEVAKIKSIEWPSESTLETLRKAADDAPADALAAAKLAQAAETDPDDLASRRILARSAVAQKDAAAAETWAREAIEIDVRDVEMHRILADSLVKRHNDREAIAEFEALLELKPDDAPAKSSLERLQKSLK